MAKVHRTILFWAGLMLWFEVLSGTFGQNLSIFQLLDQRTRARFESLNGAAIILPQLFGYEAGVAGVSEDLAQVESAIGDLTDSPSRRIAPASTAWKYFQQTFWSHPDDLRMTATSVELHYLYAPSTGLIPIALRDFRRGDSYWKTPPSEAIAAAVEPSETFLKPVLRKTQSSQGNLWSFPSHTDNLDGISVVGNASYGQTTNDCTERGVPIEVSIAQFSRFQTADCIGVVVPWKWDAQCLAAINNCTDLAFMENDSTLPRCGSMPNLAWSAYYQNATCAWPGVSLYRLSSNVSFLDLLEDSSFWAQPNGTQEMYQEIIVNTRSKANRQQDSVTEATEQATSSSGATEAAISQAAWDIQRSLISRPSTIDLTLVCAGLLANALAIDGSKVYRGASYVAGKYIRSPVTLRRVRFGGIIFSTLLSASPGLVVTGILIYLEASWGSLHKVESLSTFYGQDIYQESAGEHIWWVRSVEVHLNILSGSGTRPLYVILPVILSLFDVAFELFLVSHAFRKQYGINRIKTQDFQEGEGSEAVTLG
uniref:Uncharacterized protein n=1 Tax=Compsopogon caeruleus TaxID=31354 RepID=A0A7S1XF58_9RHOD|mmetsp:Transcript_1935/g.3494  ORF Transcript_1935/g.3494 Transcript_1935/m.3494 type:complete len:538 (+) Transcript_1935:265-1878(+)|eukprot:CAMPEP_0184687182 /NCGR_PEP_ID=MMETSP0312-20130426/25460_1 /TAXON_ID=31354 /ORGANISM="Compsopogon coeruleus, Strain SAG 36.94" /LENGTH=537 /DNA_ID=CAMNT_0027143021 /DNA_START=186 /DNA_END=1799 /DNA_ORIENTATION=-